MPNSFFEPENYPFMHIDTVIGIFTIDLTAKGEYEYSIALLPSIESSKIPWILQDLNGAFISKEEKELHVDLVKEWVESRILPPDRQNIDEILSRIGLSEYDQFAIVKYTRCAKWYDPYWVKIDVKDRYDSVQKRIGV